MTSLNQRIKTLEVYAGIETTSTLISEVSGLQEELDGKQDLLIAGPNITIIGNEISASGEIQGTLTIASVENLQTTLDAKQNQLTAGDNITILNNVISSTATGSGGATTIADVENLQTTLDTKQNQLTAGDNITILNNIISSTGGGGSSSFVGFRAVGNGGTAFSFLGRISQLLTNTNTPPYSYDTHNLFNTTTGTFFPDRNGYWQMGFKFFNQGGTATTVQTNQLKLKRGGVELGPIIFAGNNAGQSEDVTTTAYLVVGDEIYLTHEGAAVTVVLGAGNNFFEARYVGS